MRSRKTLACPTFCPDPGANYSLEWKIIVTERGNANLVKDLLQLAASTRLRKYRTARSRSTTGKTKVTKTISLYLNFNDENQYHFAIKLPRGTYQEDFWYLTAVNSVGEGFALALDTIRPLVQGGVFEEGHSIIHVQPSAKISVPADCGALPETNVIHVEFSPKAE
jgi:hypothetical protein